MATQKVPTLDGSGKIRDKHLRPIANNGGYLMACFRADSGNLGGDQRLSVLYSTDGATFIDPAYSPVYTPNQVTYPNKVVRDPSIIYRNGTFYVCHTNTGVTGTSFDIVSSTDLQNWSILATVDVSAIGSVVNTWAPEFVEDGNDVYVVFSVNATNPYWVKATNAGLTAWTTPVLLTVTGRPAKVIDPVFIKKDGTWYCFYKDDDAQQIYRATSSTVMGTYSTDKTGNWAGWGTGLEGPSVVQLHNGTYRMYLDAPLLTTDLTSFYYSDSTDLTTWTAKQSVRRYPGVAWKLRHGTVLPLTPEAGARAGSIFSSPSRYFPKKVVVQQASDVTNTSTSYANLGALSASFTPNGTKALVTISGVVSQSGSGTTTSLFQVAASGGFTGNVVMHGGVEGQSGAKFSLPAITALFTGLAPGVPVTFTLQTKITAAGTLYLRPLGQAAEGMTMTIEDAA